MLPPHATPDWLELNFPQWIEVVLLGGVGENLGETLTVSWVTPEALAAGLGLRWRGEVAAPHMQ